MTKPLASKTTFMERFRDALRIMCGELPPEDICQEWLDEVQVEDIGRLQNWVGSRCPEWAQAIVTIDAATVWADSPCEGADHEYRESDNPEDNDCFNDH